MKQYYELIFFLMFYFGSCVEPKPNNQELWEMMKSNNIDSIIDATIDIGETKNKKMLDALLYKSYDFRITHRMKFNGMSIYQIKMSTMQELTDTDPPKEITDIPDSSIIKFYTQIAKKITDKLPK